MKFGTTYICVKNIQKSLDFYKKLLQQDPVYANEDRWITFACGNSISLYNKLYDEKILKNANTECFNEAYMNDFVKQEEEKKNNIVILNFEVENLKLEYERIKSLDIGEVSEIMYVNVHMPYWYFNVKDPDGNTLEISGDYQ